MKHKREDPPLLRKDVRIIKVWTPKMVFFRAVVLDIFIKTKDEGKYIWAEGISRYARKSVPAHFHDDLKRVEFAGRDYSIPVDAEGYLTQRYGDWQTPRKDWDHIEDDRAIDSP